MNVEERISKELPQQEEAERLHPLEQVLKNEKPVIGMIHTNSNGDASVLKQAKKEIEIYLKYGAVP